MNDKITIAIDGHSSCGKSTMAKHLALALGYVYVDTGAMYRTVTLFAMREGLIQGGKVDEEGLRKRLDEVKISMRFNAQSGKQETFLLSENVETEIRTIAVSKNVSLVAALPFVRESLVRQQKLMGKDKGIVMDGRDIGTVVFPEAEMKVFVTASSRVRAQRRFDEMQAKGEPCDFAEILQNVEQRDYLDTHRSTSPLRQATDAIVLDNSYMTLEEQDLWLLAKAKERICAAQKA